MIWGQTHHKRLTQPIVPLVSDPTSSIDDITRTVDYDSIKDQKASNLLEHNMELMKALPEIVPKLKRKFK